jgi:hypothetical protein
VQAALDRHFVAPAFHASCTIFDKYVLEKTIRGNFSKSRSARIFFITSTPEIFGSIKSRMTASGRKFRIMSSPVSPSNATSTR